jgi:hypothetical protein
LFTFSNGSSVSLGGSAQDQLGYSPSEIFSSLPSDIFDSANPPQDQELFDRLLNEMLDDMGVKDEACHAIRALPERNRWGMIVQHFHNRDNRTGVQSNVKFTPEYYMKQLPPNSDKVSLKLLTSLRVSLVTHSPQWISDFLSIGGLQTLVSVHQRCHVNHPAQYVSQYDLSIHYHQSRIQH